MTIPVGHDHNMQCDKAAPDRSRSIKGLAESAPKHHRTVTCCTNLEICQLAECCQLCFGVQLSRKQGVKLSSRIRQASLLVEAGSQILPVLDQALRRILPSCELQGASCNPSPEAPTRAWTWHLVDNAAAIGSQGHASACMHVCHDPQNDHHAAPPPYA